jgi:hypothetical protein
MSEKLYKVRVRVSLPQHEDYFIVAESERDARRQAEEAAAGDFPQAFDIEATRSREAVDGE